MEVQGVTFGAAAQNLYMTVDHAGLNQLAVVHLSQIDTSRCFQAELPRDFHPYFIAAGPDAGSNCHP